ncbi:hypothetical protein FRC07_003777 [Ceratobasidium sp. 392]|nr:hypothetical protein FRC07_003777 [Ceratobasidium sp. 392]
MNIAGRSFLFINAHLAAHEGRQAMRIENMEKIQAELRLDHFGDALFPRKAIPEYLRAQEFDKLRNNMRLNKLFPGFEEPVIDCPPTFKYNVPKSRHHHHHHHHSHKDKDGKEKDRDPKSPKGVPKPLRPLAEQCESAESSLDMEEESDMDLFTSSHPHSQSQLNLNFGGERKQQRPPSTRSQPTTLPGSASKTAVA